MAEDNSNECNKFIEEGYISFDLVSRLDKNEKVPYKRQIAQVRTCLFHNLPDKQPEVYVRDNFDVSEFDTMFEECLRDS